MISHASDPRSMSSSPVPRRHSLVRRGKLKPGAGGREGAEDGPGAVQDLERVAAALQGLNHVESACAEIKSMIRRVTVLLQPDGLESR
jgi:hypothetical protein